MHASPDSRLKGEANLLIMPTLDAANIAFNLLKTAAADGVTIGPSCSAAPARRPTRPPPAPGRRTATMTPRAGVGGRTPSGRFSPRSAGGYTRRARPRGGVGRAARDDA